MDGNGRPPMTRGMMNRIMKSQPSEPTSAFGSVSTQPSSSTQRSLHTRGDRVGGYGTSQLGGRSLVRQFGAEISSPSKSRIDRMRRPQQSQTGGSGQRVNSQQNRPSAGFKEPSGRNYDPYA